jgi:hypothetical protein
MEGGRFRAADAGLPPSRLRRFGAPSRSSMTLRASEGWKGPRYIW